MLYSGEASDSLQREWLQAVVLWRFSKPMPPDFGGSNPHVIANATRRARIASEKIGRSSVGGFFAKGFYALEYSRDRNMVWVLDKAFRIPRRDSAIVVIVDRVDGIGGAPIVIGHEYISARQPYLDGRKRRTSVDITRVVRDDRNQLLQAALSTNPKVRAFLSGESDSLAVAENREFSMNVIRNQCIDFKNLKRESGEFRDCKVSEFGPFGAVGGRTYYYALYCIIPSYEATGSCGDSSFAARYHRARGLAVFTRTPSSARRRCSFERGQR
jgi:hypothetical protein